MCNKIQTQRIRDTKRTVFYTYPRSYPQPMCEKLLFYRIYVSRVTLQKDICTIYCLIFWTIEKPLRVRKEGHGPGWI